MALRKEEVMIKACYDAIVIGAGVSGASIAYMISKKKGNFLVLEEKGDVCEGSSKANSGIAHGGYDAEPGSMKAKMNILGLSMMENLSKELEFDFKKIGSLVICKREEDLPKLEVLYERGLKNGARSLSIIRSEEIQKIEPNIQDNVVAALYCKEAGIVDPFMMTIAFAEQAAVNGVDFKFYQKVIGIKKEESGWLVRTTNDSYHTKAIINAAGLYADKIHNMVCEDKYKIMPRKGEYLLLDRSQEGLVNSVIFDLPSDKGKGVLVTPTCDGNILLGPTSAFIQDKEEKETTAYGLDLVKQLSLSMVKNIAFNQVITSFTGLRAHGVDDDFIIKEQKDGFFDCMGIESPGLTSAPAIGKYVAELVQKKLQLKENDKFISKRKGLIKTRILDMDKRIELVKKDPNYGQIICRCESVSEGEILNAIRRPLGAKSLDGLKRRVRVTAGRCQGGFCTPKLIEILSRELDMPPEEVTKKDGEAYLLIEKTR